MLCASCSAEPCSWARGASADPTAQVLPSLLCGCEDSPWVWAGGGSVAPAQPPWQGRSQSDREQPCFPNLTLPCPVLPRKEVCGV